MGGPWQTFIHQTQAHLYLLYSTPQELGYRMAAASKQGAGSDLLPNVGEHEHGRRAQCF